MSVWIELHCDRLREGQLPNDILRLRCWSNDGNSPGVMAHNPTADVKETLKNLQIEARKAGWKTERIAGRTEWVCPGCQLP